MYLVQAWSETSAPSASGWQKSGEAQVLSTISTAPRAWAASASAGKSWISKVSEPGDSPTTTLVFSRIRSAMPAPDAGVVERGLDPHAPEQPAREAPRRAVGAVRHQHVVAALHEGEQRRHDRRLAGAEEVGPVAPLKRGDRILQREGRGRAVAAVIGLAVLARAEGGLPQRRRVLVQDRRRVVDGRVDHAVVRRRVAPQHREQRLVPVAPRAALALAHRPAVPAMTARPLRCRRSNGFPPRRRGASPRPGRRAPRSPRTSTARPPDSRACAAPRTWLAPQARRPRAPR